MATNGEFYTFALSVRLSKNYNSAEARVEFGRAIKSGETKAALIADVEKTVETQLGNALEQIDVLLSPSKR